MKTLPAQHFKQSWRLWSNSHHQQGLIQERKFVCHSLDIQLQCSQCDWRRPTQPDPRNAEGNQAKQYPPKNFQKHVCLLGTSYNYFALENSTRAK